MNISLALEALRSGKPIILVDDEHRENEGDLVVAAEKITPQTMNFMIRHGSGIVCLCLPSDRCDELDLPPMVSDNHNQFGTAFTVSIEAKTGVTTGVSAADRTRTVLAAIDSKTKPSDLARPGHMFPLRAVSGGVLKRRGHTEGSIDLVSLAGLKPAAVICELMNADGTMSRMDDIARFAKEHSVKIVSIADIVAYREEISQ